MTEDEKKEIVDFLENQVKTGENMTGSSYNVWLFKNRLQKALKLVENSVPKEAIREKIEDIEDYFDRLNVPDEDIKFIREKRKGTVRDYMEYEETTYKQLLENADLTTMVLKYPELNSNELVKMEIETYKENSKKIKELKEDKIGKSRKAWWLYFGN